MKLNLNISFEKTIFYTDFIDKFNNFLENISTGDGIQTIDIFKKILINDFEFTKKQAIFFMNNIALQVDKEINNGNKEILLGNKEILQAIIFSLPKSIVYKKDNKLFENIIRDFFETGSMKKSLKQNKKGFLDLYFK